MTSLDQSNQTLNRAHYLVQFVCFETILRASLFHPVWKPFANRFLSKGIEVLILNGAKESPTQSVPFRFISQNWWPKRRFEEAFPNGQLVGDVNIGLVRVSQAGGFVFSDCTLPEGTDPRTSFDGNKLFVLGYGSPLSSAEVEAAQQASQAEAALFFARSAENRESLFDWLLELRGDQPITAQRREELQNVLLAGGAQRRVAFQIFQQSLRLSDQ